jgi:hypothetical protein
MTINLTASVVREGLLALVEQEGEDFVYEGVKQHDGYPKCVYVRNGEPDCIVGRLLANLGVPVDRLVEADEDQYMTGVPAAQLLGELREEGVITLATGEGVANALAQVQHLQDSRIAWGAAVDSGLVYLK